MSEIRAEAQRLRPRSGNGTARPRLLVVEDEPALRDAMEFGLDAEGFEIDAVPGGAAALDAFERARPDLVLLDLMLPDLSGLEVCRRLRARDRSAGGGVPIVMVTARDSEIDVVVGLELGADDYVTKPFSMRELAARVRAVLRRGDVHAIDEGPVAAAGVVVDPERHEVGVRGETVDLPPKEFALLELLVRNAGRVLTRDVIIDRVWGADYVGDTKTLDVHVKRLRSRIEVDPRDPQLITTIRGVGYKFAEA